MPEIHRIAVLGAGNIGSALIGGMLKGGLVRPDQLVATVGTEQRAEEVSRRFLIRATAGGNLEATEGADVVILAVKQTMVPRVLEEIRWGLRDDRVLVSLAGGYPLDSLAEVLGRPMPMFRAMPNIAVLVDEGATCIAHSRTVTAAQKAVVERIFESAGVVCWVEEAMLPAGAALSASGPAYVYMMIEAMIAGGLKIGLSHDVATRLAEQTVLGAAKLVRQTGEHPAILRDQVVTPGGATIAAVHELEKLGLRAMIISAIETAALHSQRIAAQLLQKAEVAQ